MLVNLINPMSLLACKALLDIAGHQQLDQYQQILLIVPPQFVHLHAEQQDPETQC